MSETITTSHLLDFLAKAHKVSSHVTVTKVTNYYTITVYADWHDDDNFHDKTTYITAEGHSPWDMSDYEFFTMGSVLDELIEKEKEREIKRQKRQELLSRLTDEEKELLGVK